MSSFVIDNPRFETKESIPFSMYGRNAIGGVGSIAPGVPGSVLTSAGPYAVPRFQALATGNAAALSAKLSGPFVVDGTTPYGDEFQTITGWQTEYNVNTQFDGNTGEVTILAAGQYAVEGMFDFVNSQMDRTCVLELSTDNGATWTVVHERTSAGNVRTPYVDPANDLRTVPARQATNIQSFLQLAESDRLRLGSRVPNSSGVDTFRVASISTGIPYWYRGQIVTSTENVSPYRGPSLKVASVTPITSICIPEPLSGLTFGENISYISSLAYGDADPPSGVLVDPTPGFGGSGYEQDREYTATFTGSTIVPFRVLATVVTNGALMEVRITNTGAFYLPTAIGSSITVEGHGSDGLASVVVTGFATGPWPVKNFQGEDGGTSITYGVVENAAALLTIDPVLNETDKAINDIITLTAGTNYGYHIPVRLQITGKTGAAITTFDVVDPGSGYAATDVLTIANPTVGDTASFIVDVALPGVGVTALEVTSSDAGFGLNDRVTVTNTVDSAYVEAYVTQLGPLGVVTELTVSKPGRRYVDGPLTFTQRPGSLTVTANATTGRAIFAINEYFYLGTGYAGKYALPIATGSVAAIEIVDPGDGYGRAPASTALVGQGPGNGLEINVEPFLSAISTTGPVSGRSTIAASGNAYQLGQVVSITGGNGQATAVVSAIVGPPFPGPQGFTEIRSTNEEEEFPILALSPGDFELSDPGVAVAPGDAFYYVSANQEQMVLVAETVLPESVTLFSAAFAVTKI